MTDLQRFHDAQEGSYDGALTELRRGRKTSHWMWWVFPQVAGLGSSPTSQHFAIGSLEEAQAYAADDVLGPRLVEAARAVLAHPDSSAHAIMGSPDDVKLRSSMTLFAIAAPGEPVFGEVLDTFFGGERDPRTEAFLAR
jgi:uncharacterized protein (DUF1810 family)